MVKTRPLRTEHCLLFAGHRPALVADWPYVNGWKCIVRTNIVVDDRLVREAMKLAGAKTLREAVDIALRCFVQIGRQKKLLDLYGTGGMRKDYDYKRARSGA